MGSQASPTRGRSPAGAISRRRQSSKASLRARCLGYPAGQARSTITVRIESLRHDRGTIYVAALRQQACIRREEGASRRRPGTVAESWGPRGVRKRRTSKYAIAFFQDENGNGKLDTNLLGIPTEGFGFSKDAMGKLGPPTFAAAVLSIPAGPVSVVMHAKYF